VLAVVGWQLTALNRAIKYFNINLENKKPSLLK
jgi:hypothetical protein